MIINFNGQKWTIVAWDALLGGKTMKNCEEVITVKVRIVVTFYEWGKEGFEIGIGHMEELLQSLTKLYFLTWMVISRAVFYVTFHVFSWWLTMLNIFSFICWPSVCLLWKAVYSEFLPIFKLDCLFSCCLLVCVLYILWILDPYQIYDLQ